MTMDRAAAHVESWLERKIVTIINPGPRHAELLFGFLRAEGKGGNLTTDAHLAALAVEARNNIHRRHRFSPLLRSKVGESAGLICPAQNESRNRN